MTDFEIWSLKNKAFLASDDKGNYHYTDRQLCKVMAMFECEYKDMMDPAFSYRNRITLSRKECLGVKPEVITSAIEAFLLSKTWPRASFVLEYHEYDVAFHLMCTFYAV